MKFPKYVFEAEYDLLDEGQQPSEPQRQVVTVEAPSLCVLLAELAARLRDSPHAFLNALHVERFTREQWFEKMQARLDGGISEEEFRARAHRLRELWRRELLLE
jgi:hypothetical protein